MFCCISAKNQSSKSELKLLAGQANQVRTSMLDEIRNKQIEVPPLTVAVNHKRIDEESTTTNIKVFHEFMRHLFIERCKNKSIHTRHDQGDLE